MSDIEKALGNEREFTAQVIRNLPKKYQLFPAGAKQFWLENPKLLNRVLSQALTLEVDRPPRHMYQYELDEFKREIFDFNVSNLRVSQNCVNSLYDMGIETLGQLFELSEDDLTQGGCNKISIREIVRFLLSLGITLKK